MSINPQKMLDEELARLKAKVGLAGHLKVIWEPKEVRIGSESGTVRGSTIVIHDLNINVALRTLRHEYLEYVLTEEFFIPRFFEVKSHIRVDSLVEIISKLIFENEVNPSVQ